jgi:hypothetical protein
MAEFKSARQVLAALAAGWSLKAHRDLEGNKDYRLHPLEGEPAAVRAETVAALVEQGLIDSNKKFPAATFWLTAKGRERALGASAQDDA